MGQQTPIRAVVSAYNNVRTDGSVTGLPLWSRTATPSQSLLADFCFHVDCERVDGQRQRLASENSESADRGFAYAHSRRRSRSARLAGPQTRSSSVGGVFEALVEDARNGAEAERPPRKGAVP
jgi:hypothetical protein